MNNLLLLSLNINTDLFETNIINIGILIIVLFNFVGNILQVSLLERKQNILNRVQDAERGLKEASERLVETRIQLNQSKLIIEKINADKDKLKQTLAITNRDRALEELSRDIETTKLSIAYREQQTFQEIKKEIVKLALNKVILVLQKRLDFDTQRELVDNCIKFIGESNGKYSCSF